MNRRQFIVAYNVSSASSLLAAVSLAHASATAHNCIKNRVDTLEIGSRIPRLGLVAVGGLGSNTLRVMAENLSIFHRVIAINTDADALQRVHADRKIRVGIPTSLRRSPQQVVELAVAARPEIENAVAGLDMVLLVTGMGGAAGTGISPVVAQVLRQLEVLSLGFAVMPFEFEGQERQAAARQGLLALQSQSPALIVAHNTDIAQGCDADTPMDWALCQAPQAFAQLCSSIGGLVPSHQNIINFDIEDLRRLIVQNQGVGAFGFGVATVAEGVVVAAQKALAHPLLGLKRLRQAQAALVTVDASPNTLLLRDLKSMMNLVRSQLPPDASVVYGTPSGSTAADEAFRVSIWAHGLGKSDSRQAVS